MKYFFWIFFWAWTAALSAQTDSLLPPDVLEEEVILPEEDFIEEAYTPPYTPPPAKPVSLRDIDESKWNKATSGLDYSKDVPEPVEPPKVPDASNPSMPAFDWSGLSAGLGYFFQILAIIAGILGIAYGIYKMINTPRNRQITRDGVEITLDNVEQYIHESDLERFLREALAAGNYSLAVRLYYLMIIKQLSEKNAIRWSREKTNRDYLRETRNHRSANEFRATTRIYERIWYGNQSLDATAFAGLEPSFKNLLAQL